MTDYIQDPDIALQILKQENIHLQEGRIEYQQLLQVMEKANSEKWRKLQRIAVLLAEAHVHGEWPALVEEFPEMQEVWNLVIK